MKTAESLLELYASAEIDLDALAAGLERALAGDANGVEQLLTLLEAFVARGRIPALAAEQIRERIAAIERPRADDSRTQARSVWPDEDDNDDGTRLQPGPEKADDLFGVQTAPREGDLVKGRFLLIERIGEGGMGVVFKALDQRMQEAEDRDPYVAIKFLSQGFRRHPAALQVLQREVRKAHQTAHPNVVTVYDFDRDGALIYMTMEYMRGTPLDEFIRNRRGAGLSIDEVWPIVSGAGRALAYAHEKGLVHSDFKPGNVMLTDDGVAKVLDFGIARVAKTEGAKEQPDFDVATLGANTPSYASPEMLSGEESDPRDDVYALACVTYELLSGRHPFDRKPANEAQRNQLRVPPITGASRAVMRALAHGLAFTRDQRTASIPLFLGELRPVSKWPWVLGAAGVLSAITLSWFILSAQQHAQQCERLDQEMLAGFKAASPETLDPSDIETKQDLMILADLLLERTETEFSEADMDSAFEAYKMALQIDRDTPDADTGLLRVLQLYEQEARALYQRGEYAEAVKVASLGLGKHPKHCGLLAIKADAEAGLS